MLAIPPSQAAVVEVDQLLVKLETNLESAQLSSQQRDEALAQVKVFGRNQDTAGSIFTRRGISILSKYGLDHSTWPEASREALRCLANAFLLNEASRQIFVDLGYAPKIAKRLKADNWEDEFLVSRILFYLTYNTKVDFEVLFKQNLLAESINQRVLRHAKVFSQSACMKSGDSPMQGMAMAETLKLMFNLTVRCSELTSEFTPAVGPLLDILLHHPLPNPPLQPPITYLVNALLNLDLKSAERNTRSDSDSGPSCPFPCPDAEPIVARLIRILDAAIRSHPEADLDHAAAPLLTLLRCVCELATPQVQSFMRGLLLPGSKDRETPLGQGQSLASRLLRLSCSPHLPTLRGNISGLLFELSDKDANTFVKNVGYGFASGFLTSHNIDIPPKALAAGRGGSDDGAGTDAEFNPITGQRWDAEERGASKTEYMTEEEKEREAEKLFVLFERLKATGVVDVKNPVEEAIEQGRFEELD